MVIQCRYVKILRHALPLFRSSTLLCIRDVHRGAAAAAAAVAVRGRFFSKTIAARQRRGTKFYNTVAAAARELCLNYRRGAAAAHSQPRWTSLIPGEPPIIEE